MTERNVHDTAALLRRQSRALERQLPLAIAGDELGVHRARVASRRLRESVPVLAAGLKGSKARKARRTIRRLTRALGMVRELDVALRVVDELAADPRTARPALDAVRAHLLAERQRRRDDMLEKLASINIDKLHRKLTAVVEAIDPDEAPWRRALARRLLSRAKRLTVAMQEAGQLYAPDRLHGVRIAVKKLRYGLELAAEGGAGAAAPLVRGLKRTQAQLGRLQDLQVLLQRLAAVQASASAPREADRGLEAIATRLENECRRLHGRYVAGSRALADIAVETRRCVVPQILHHGRPRRLKMALEPARGAAAAARR